jgi:hypothetical protein
MRSQNVEGSGFAKQYGFPCGGPDRLSDLLIAIPQRELSVYLDDRTEMKDIGTWPTWVVPTLAVIGLSAGLGGISIQIPSLFPPPEVLDASAMLEPAIANPRSFREPGEELPMPSQSAGVIPAESPGDSTASVERRLTVVDVWTQW